MGIDAIVLIKTNVTLTDADLVRLNWRLVEAAGRHFYAPAITRVAPDDCAYGTDADLRVSWGMRYYGNGYERGDWPVIDSVLRWFRLNLPDGVVYYGGDSSETLWPFTAEASEAVWAHWAEHGGVPYNSAWNRTGRSVPCCGGDCYHLGGHGSTDLWECPICEAHWESTPRTEPVRRQEPHP